MLPQLKDDQDGYLREFGASELLKMNGESSGHVFCIACTNFNTSQVICMSSCVASDQDGHT